MQTGKQACRHAGKVAGMQVRYADRLDKARCVRQVGYIGQICGVHMSLCLAHEVVCSTFWPKALLTILLPK